MKRIFTVVLIAALLSLCLGAAALADETEDAALIPVGAEEAPAEDTAAEAPADEPEPAPVDDDSAAEPAAEPADEPAAEPDPTTPDEAPAEDTETEPEADGTQISAGTCGEKAAWSYDPDTKTLTVTGEGSIDAITDENAEVWADATDIVIEDGITEIGRDAFKGLANLAKVTVPESVEKIGAGSFLSCPKLADMTVLNKDCEFETYDVDSTETEIDKDAAEKPEPYATMTPFDYILNSDDATAKEAWEETHPLNDGLTITAPEDSTAKTFCDTYPQKFEEYVDPDAKTDDNKDTDDKKDAGDNKDTSDNKDPGNNNTDTNSGSNNNTTAPSESTSPSPAGITLPTATPTPLGTSPSASPASDSDSPRTGDETPVALYVVLITLLTAAAGCTGVILVKKSRG